ncbi:alpha/beta hydrolase [Jatrophihabitans cynanchi]|uniref:Alpha/beta hydrolase n=1 Tax=Jatrophihabitans cynanchi TaxID=2944128 RepID=A0ABY7K3E6_9ACTN|nr:alpha/beta hydrolase [Jatrophihabitans sp. SB3-54]WAX57869.1 alpha/beta hydrolase [Jatrophihabitans sp. SB3-54]
MRASSSAVRPPEPDFSAITTDELRAYRDAENEYRASEAARQILGKPHAGAAIGWQDVALPGRDVPVRVYRPDRTGGDGPAARSQLPLVVHVHGGGFVGTAVQCDWTNSYLAARLPAIVVSVEHRLLSPGSSLADAADDAWEVLRHVMRHASRWAVDPDRAAVFGESCGALICALTAIRARTAGLRLAAQVLVNPAVDVTDTMFDYPSIAGYPATPTLALPQLRLIQRLGVPQGTDATALSPVYADDLSGLAPALVVVPTHDPLADHGRRHAERLRAAGTAVQLTEYPGAQHAFLTLPGVAPQAQAARAEIAGFLRATLAR